MFKVAILGCPNVGKSTLFNQMVRRHQAVICDRPGVTRDYNEKACLIAGKNIIVIDSPGWGYQDEFSAEIQKNITNVLNIVQLIVLVVEPEVNPQDKEFSLWLRKNSKLPIILAINKSEKQRNIYGGELGWNDILNISAKHSIGLNILREKIASYVGEQTTSESSESKLKISILGRPNVGKSTFINQLLKENRVITSPIAGTTRDSIEVGWRCRNQDIILIDTPGMRKRAKINEELESLSVGSSIYSIRQADVVILMIDATRGFEHQDLSIANIIIKEGKALVIVVNKSDLSNEKNLSHVKYSCSHHLPNGITIVNISALKNKNCNKIINACISSHKISKQTIPTSRLNKWLSHATKKHKPPLSSRNTSINLKFISQIGINPFTFKIIVNIPEDIDKSYIRYLENDLRKEFKLGGLPVKIVLEKNYNPYLKKSRKC